MDKRYQQALKQQGFTDEEVRAGIKLQLDPREGLREGDRATSRSRTATSRTTTTSTSSQYETPAQPESRDVRHILVKSEGGRPTASTSSCKANPAEFAQLAKKYSTDTSSQGNGGELRRARQRSRAARCRAVREGRLLDQDERDLAAGALAVRLAHHPGASGPIKPGKPATPTPLSQVKEAIRQQLLASDKRNTEMHKLARTG